MWSMTTDPIRRVSLISTGTVSIHPEQVGPTWKPLYLWLLTSRRWTAPRPINAYLVEHERGLILFDSGQDRASVTDPSYFPGGLNGVVYRRLATFDIGADDTLSAQLQRLGYRIEDVDTVVLSHLHQDHIGGLRELKHAEILVSQAEWATASRALPEARGFLRAHIQLPGLRWRRLVPESLADRGLLPFTHGHDIFGDGSVVVVPTPGHTPGSLSMVVRRPRRAPLMFVGDLTYDANLMAAGKVPGLGNKKQVRAAVAAVGELRRRYPTLAVLPAHDPGAASRLATAVNGGRPEDVTSVNDRPPGSPSAIA